jgi:exonuclease SbcD
MALLARPCFDYVALGHVHRHQILCDAPPVVYPGSIERVDFSEEKEEKGYVRVDVERGNVQVEFCPLPVRRFQTIRLDLSESEDPQAELLAALEAETLTDAVVRLVYQVQSAQLDQIDLNVLQEALSSAHSYSIYPELTSQLARARLPELGSSSSTDPLEALQAYLETQPHLAELSVELLSAAEALLSSDGLPSWSLEEDDLVEEAVVEVSSAQLRLL